MDRRSGTFRRDSSCSRISPGFRASGEIRDLHFLQIILEHKELLSRSSEARRRPHQDRGGFLLVIFQAHRLRGEMRGGDAADAEAVQPEPPAGDGNPALRASATARCCASVTSTSGPRSERGSCSAKIPRRPARSSTKAAPTPRDHRGHHLRAHRSPGGRLRGNYRARY